MAIPNIRLSDILQQIRLELNGELKKKIFDNPTLLGLIGFSSADPSRVISSENGDRYVWTEQPTKALTITPTAVNGNVITVPLADLSKVKVGQNLYPVDDTVVFEITNINTTTGDITLAVGYANFSSTTAPSAGMVFKLGSAPVPSYYTREDATGTWRQGSSEENFFRTVLKRVRASNLVINTSTKDGISSNFDWQTLQTLNDIVREIEYELLFSYRKTWIAQNNSNAGYAGGIAWLIQQGRVHATQQTGGGDLTQTTLKGVLKDLIEEQGNPLYLVTGWKTQGVISTWNDGLKYTTIQDQTTGTYINQIINPYSGNALRILIDTTIPEDRVYLIDPSSIEVKYKTVGLDDSAGIQSTEYGSSFLPITLTDVSQSGEAGKWFQMATSYTFEWSYPESGLAIIYGLT